MKYQKFEDLPIWQEAIKITKIVYDHSANDKWRKDFGLRDQIRRAIISVSSNIVEGFEKRSNNEFARFLKIAKGSLAETKNQLYVALEIGYITQKEFNLLDEKLTSLARQIGGLINYLVKSKRIHNP